MSVGQTSRKSTRLGAHYLEAALQAHGPLCHYKLARDLVRLLIRITGVNRRGKADYSSCNSVLTKYVPRMTEEQPSYKWSTSPGF